MSRQGECSWSIRVSVALDRGGYTYLKQYAPIINLSNDSFCIVLYLTMYQMYCCVYSPFMLPS